jgi:hypothetical protein
MRQWCVIEDPDEVSDFLGTFSNPFDLKSDLKTARKYISIGALSANLILEVDAGPRGETYHVISGDKKSAHAAKIRIGYGNVGKSNGFRVYALVVPQLDRIVLLGITMHSLGNKESEYDKPNVSLLLGEVINDICKKCQQEKSA